VRRAKRFASRNLYRSSKIKHLDSFADSRLIVGCVYCGGVAATREHVPSKVFLDVPFPENLPIVGACRPCNNGFSLDEEYVACLVEAVIAGSAAPEEIRRSSVAAILMRAPALQAKLEAAKSFQDGRTVFAIEQERVKNVIVKLARGHAAFELSQPCKDEPIVVLHHPLAMLTDEQKDAFEATEVAPVYGEIGSRGMQRMLVAQLTFQSGSGAIKTEGMIINDWVDVQEGRYRYHASDYGDLIQIKLVIGEYLACLVEWRV